MLRTRLAIFLLASLILPAGLSAQHHGDGHSYGGSRSHGGSHARGGSHYHSHSHSYGGGHAHHRSSPSDRSSRPHYRHHAPHASSPRYRSHRTVPRAHAPKAHASRPPRVHSPPAPGPRDRHGRLKRSQEAKRDFERTTGHPHGWPGHVIDHRIPLACGGADAPSNMQWQTAAEAKAKDRIEQRGCR